MGDLLTVHNGWLWINDGSDHLKVYFQVCKGKVIDEPLMLEHYEGGFNFGIGGGKKYLVLLVQNILIPSHADYEIFMANLLSWQEDDDGFTVEVIRDSSNNKIAWDGTNTAYTMMLKSDVDAIEKKAPGDGDVYVIGKLLLEESG